MKKVLTLTITILITAGAAALLWYFVFGRAAGTLPTVNQNGVVQNSQSFPTTSGGGSGTDTPTVAGGVTPGSPVAQKIFKLADGPVMSATIYQSSLPTTTLARYVMQNDGHVFDIPLDVAGGLARVISNTTIPGLGSGVWLPTSNTAALQYLDGSNLKTVLLGFGNINSATSSVKIRFLPDGVLAVAGSPDGKRLVYLLPSAGGATGYLANVDGSNPVKLFTSPLSQVLLSWPSSGTLLLQSKSAAGVPGIAFSVSALTGTLTPLVYTQGLSATANGAFTKIIYQTTPSGGLRTTYAHDVVSGRDFSLPFNPFPEKCSWSPASSFIVFCAAPLGTTPANYLDYWHQGLLSTPDSLFSFDIGGGVTSLLATPGEQEGGIVADIASVAVSPDGAYLVYITKGDRSLWGVKLTP